jgi:hypothetical protein
LGLCCAAFFGQPAHRIAGIFLSRPEAFVSSGEFFEAYAVPHFSVNPLIESRDFFEQA